MPIYRLRRDHLRLLAITLLVLVMLAMPGEAAWAQPDTATLQGQQTACISFQETGYSICNGFLRYWQANGGLQIFGYPITGEFIENGLTVQYFERARFEWHPGVAPAQWDVLLGRLGTESMSADREDISTALDLLKASVAPFKDLEAAKSAGWNLQPGLDYCFDNPGVGGMGIHYINAGMLDTSLDPLKPEAMVYQQGADGSLTLGAVEWIVPADAWDAEAHGQLLPELLGHHLHLNSALGVYVLHAWIFTDNPAGMFEDWNPNVSCSQ